MNPSLLNLVSQEDKLNLLNLPQIVSLPQDQRDEAVNDILEQIIENVLTRMSQALTEADMQKIEEIISSDKDNTEAIKYFLLTKMPNLDEVIKEEVTTYQKS